MAKAKMEQFWMGKGVIMIDGKEFGAGISLPVDKMDKDVLKNQIAKGNIGEKIAPVEANDLATVNANLASQLEEAMKANADLTEELEDSLKANVDLTKELEEATKPMRRE